MLENPTLSIAIVNWNAGQFLDACLLSIFANPPECTYEIWLVDNASTDGSTSRVINNFPQVKPILNPGNPGFAAANNQAIHTSAGRYFLLLNPDTIVKTGSLQELVDFLENHPDAGACGPRLSNPDGSLQVSCYPFPTAFRELWRLVHLDKLVPAGIYPVHKWSQDKPRQVDALQGACLLIRRSAVDQVGDLDPGYFMYTEEIDYCHRLKVAGWGIFWVPGSEIIHYGGQSTRHAADEMFLNLYSSKIRFFRQRYSDLSAAAYKGIIGVAALLRLAITPLAYLEKKPSRINHLSLARQYWMLLKALPNY